ncbi:hypothetical protein HZB88_03375 [archaeon]|nr:hypothetical protein [archaeon]
MVTHALGKAGIPYSLKDLGPAKGIREIVDPSDPALMLTDAGPNSRLIVLEGMNREWGIHVESADLRRAYNAVGAENSQYFGLTEEAKEKLGSYMNRRKSPTHRILRALKLEKLF